LMARRLVGISRKRLILRRMAWRRMCAKWQQDWDKEPSRKAGGMRCVLKADHSNARGLYGADSPSWAFLDTAWPGSKRPRLWVDGSLLPLGGDPFGGPASSDGAASTTLPCGLRQDQVLDLMFRDIKPEDYDLLNKLDETVPKTNTATKSVVEQLPRVLPGSLKKAEECGVCLMPFAPDVPVAKLPCEHAFHVACIEKWLTQCKNSCPICTTPMTPTAA